MKEHKKELIKIFVCAVLLLIALTFNQYPIIHISLCMISYAICGFSAVVEAIEEIKEKNIFNENLLMIIASIGAICLEDFMEASIVMLLFNVSELLEEMGKNKVSHSLDSLNNLKPSILHKVMSDGSIVDVPHQEIEVNDTILVKVGEQVQTDGVICDGSSSFDYSKITGESTPIKLTKEQEVVSGTINLSSAVKITCTKKCEDSTISQIIKFVNDKSSKKSKKESFMSKFAKIYTPTVLICAFLIVIFPCLLGGDFNTWLYRGLIFLVVSCPCALIISIPLGFYCGIGACSKIGVLIKSSGYLEDLSTINAIAFDKTGTITNGNFVVTKLAPTRSSQELLECACIAEQHSSHPIAKSILDYAGETPTNNGYSTTDISGKGVLAQNNTTIILVGNQKLLTENNISFQPEQEIGTIVYVAKNGEYLGYIVISDTIKQNSQVAIQELKNRGIKSFILSGDNETSCREVCKNLAIENYKSSLLPMQKIEELKAIQSICGKTAFVGDGVNDSPCLSCADLAISMGNKGSDIAIDVSDIVLLNDDINSLVSAHKISKKTKRIVLFNAIFSIGIKLLILLLGSLGFSNMYMAILADVGLSALAILNSLRILKNQR